MAFTMHSHSGQFCPGHAVDQLEDIIKHAIAIGFKTIGLTEHMPRYEECDLYPEEVRIYITYNRSPTKFPQKNPSITPSLSLQYNIYIYIIKLTNQTPSLARRPPILPPSPPTPSRSLPPRSPTPANPLRVSNPHSHRLRSRIHPPLIHPARAPAHPSALRRLLHRLRAPRPQHPHRLQRHALPLRRSRIPQRLRRVAVRRLLRPAARDADGAQAARRRPL